MPWRIDFPGALKLFWGELALRLFIITAFIVTENLDPFWRQIQPEEVWLYSYPNTTGYITTLALYVIAVFASIGVIAIFFVLNRDFYEAWIGLLVPSLAIPLCGILTNAIKISVGRPRPDYFARCYPGLKQFDINRPCSGDAEKVLEGRKSFPSGHSSIIFCAMGFVFLYLAGKLGTFNSRGRGQTWKLVLPICPLIFALLVAISRTADYHHHWQDVTVGSLLGSLVAYTVYRQYYPCLGSKDSNIPFALNSETETKEISTSGLRLRNQYTPNSHEVKYV